MRSARMLVMLVTVAAGACGGTADLVVGKWGDSAGNVTIELGADGTYREWSRAYPADQIANPANPVGAKQWGSFSLTDENLILTVRDAFFEPSLNVVTHSRASFFADGERVAFGVFRPTGLLAVDGVSGEWTVESFSEEEIARDPLARACVRTTLTIGADGTAHEHFKAKYKTFSPITETPSVTSLQDRDGTWARLGGRKGIRIAWESSNPDGVPEHEDYTLLDGKTLARSFLARLY